MLYSPAGIRVDPDGDTLNIYYGAADCAIALARASVHSLLDWLDANAITNAVSEPKTETVPQASPFFDLGLAFLPGICELSCSDAKAYGVIALLS